MSGIRERIICAMLGEPFDLKMLQEAADEIARLRLTDAEREAVEWAEAAAANAQHPAESVLRSMRERHAP